MGALARVLPQHLRTFVEPQVEQLSFSMEPVRCGLYGTLPESLGEGFLWTAALGEDCLVSVHSLRLRKPFSLEERPSDFACIFSGSRATIQSTPQLRVRAAAERENLAAFTQPGGTTRCLLQAGALYESTSITYTPAYFERLERIFPDDFASAREAMDSFDPANPPAKIRFILRELDPARALLPGAEPCFHAKALEAISALLAGFDASAKPQVYQDDCTLVEQAEALIAARFAEHLTAASIAHELYVSRSRLCEAFRRGRGVGVGEAIRRERMEAACRLLENGRLCVAEVARAVGYARASSFDEAFRREFGCSPTQYAHNAAAR